MRVIRKLRIERIITAFPMVFVSPSPCPVFEKEKSARKNMLIAREIKRIERLKKDDNDIILMLLLINKISSPSA